MDIIAESNLQKWEEHLKSFSSTPFFSSAWIESFKNKNRIPIYLRFVSEGRTIGIAAGLRIEPSNVLFKKLFRILFFYSCPALIETDNNLTKMCLAKLLNFSRDNGYTHINLSSYDYPYPIDAEGLPFRFSTRREYIMDLRGNMADLRKKMKKRMTEVRAAERNGLTFHENSYPKIIDDLLFLLEETKSIRLSKSYEKYSYFYISWLDKEILCKLIKNRIARAFYVKKQDDILSVSLELVHNKKAYGLFIGTNQVGYKLKANTLLNFKVIETLKSEGVEHYNFGGVPDDTNSKGLIFYKTSFGANEHMCTGGYTPHLQNPSLNYLTNVYLKWGDPFRVRSKAKNTG